MPHEGYDDPVMNDGPRFHSDMSVSELIEHDTRAIEASVVSSTSERSRWRLEGGE